MVTCVRRERNGDMCEDRNEYCTGINTIRDNDRSLVPITPSEIMTGLWFP